MKSNAIIRIVLFSVVIVILAGILLAGLGLHAFTVITEGGQVSQENHEAQEIPGNQETQNVLGNQETQEVQKPTGKSFEIPAAQVQGLDIDWAAGSITIQTQAETDIITFSEAGGDNGEKPMVWKQEDNHLSIDYQENYGFAGIQTSKGKDLTITVPADWVCHELEIDAVSGEVAVSGLTVREMDFDGASAVCSFDNCVVDNFDLETASGEVNYHGQLNCINVSAMSADCHLNLTNTPSRIDLEGMSGDLILTLPDDCGYTVSTNGLNCNFSSEFETGHHDNHHSNGSHQHTHGDGRCRINVSAMSGDVRICKGH